MVSSPDMIHTVAVLLGDKALVGAGIFLVAPVDDEIERLAKRQ
jgi:hypothetical protein